MIRELEGLICEIRLKDLRIYHLSELLLWDRQDTHLQVCAGCDHLRPLDSPSKRMLVVRKERGLGGCEARCQPQPAEHFGAPLPPRNPVLSAAPLARELTPSLHWTPGQSHWHLVYKPVFSTRVSILS